MKDTKAQQTKLWLMKQLPLKDDVFFHKEEKHGAAQDAK